MLISIVASSQNFCSTPASINNPELNNSSYLRATNDDYNYLLRIYFHVIRRSNGTGGQSFQKVSENEIKSLLNETILKTEHKTRLKFSTFNKQVTSLVAVRILESEKVAKKHSNSINSQKYKTFSKSVWLTDKNMIDDIHAESINYLKAIK